MQYHKTTLSNGLRIISVPVKDAVSATAMVLVGVGARHETSEIAGIAHFIEHNVFKGTTKRPSHNQVVEEIEGLGGVTNAATGHEMTYYWAKAGANQIEKILDVILDISVNMTFPAEDLEIERGNVIEEINMYQDNPMRRIMKDYVNFVWDGHPVGRNILGTRESIEKINRDQMLSFIHQNYQPKNMVVILAGKIDRLTLEKRVEEFFQTVRPSEALSLVEKQNMFIEFQTSNRVYLDTSDTKQTHICLGYKTFGRNDEQRYVLDLMNTILGNGMSSRLFTRIREKLGLAYYVGSDNWELEETGLWFARAGVDNQRVDQAIKAILDEFHRLADEKVPETELRKSKEYVKGKTLLSVETSDELGGWYGFQELLEPEVLSPEQYNEKIEAITAEDIQKLAQNLLRQDRLNLGLVGPFESKQRFEDLVSK